MSRPAPVAPGGNIDMRAGHGWQRLASQTDLHMPEPAQKSSLPKPAKT